MTNRVGARSRRRLRLVLAFLLLAVAVAWPTLDLAPTSATMFEITPQHGVNVADLAALVPFTLAIALAWPRAARAGHPRR